MKRYAISFRQASIGLFVLGLTVGSCRKNGVNGSAAANTRPRALQVFLTDDPALSFDKVLIDIQKLEIKAEDSAEDLQERQDQSGNDSRDAQGDASGGWMTFSIQPGVYDLLQFRNGLDTLLSAGTLPAFHNIRKVRLTLGPDDSVVSNGVAQLLTIGGNNNIVVIRIPDDFLDDNPSSIDFSLDFDAGKSIRMKGSRLELDPRLRAFRKERTGGIEGRVSPTGALPIIMAMSATDTATAQPDSEGEFKIDGLRPGSYSLFIHPTAGLFRDTTLTNITLSGNEDINVGTVLLQP